MTRVSDVLAVFAVCQCVTGQQGRWYAVPWTLKTFPVRFTETSEVSRGCRNRAKPGTSPRYERCEDDRTSASAADWGRREDSRPLGAGLSCSSPTPPLGCV